MIRFLRGWTTAFRWRIGLVLLVLIIVLLPQCMSIRMSDKAIAQYFANRSVKPTFGTVSNNGHTVHYARIGADSLPTVLFIHGSPGSWDAFIGFFTDSSLYNHAQLISVDRPGFGKSELGRPEKSLQAQAAAIAPLLRQKPATPKPIVVGHSLGGPVAVRLAMDYPEQVGGLVLVAPSIDPDLERGEWYRPIGAAFPVRYLLPTELDVSNREIMALKAELQAMRPLWSTIRVPVTVIQGTEDELVSPDNAAFARSMLQQATVTIQMIPGMNHFIPWRRPDLIRTAIRQQLSTNQSNFSTNKQP
ncbi:alpha/beta fold hydrolase [Spirosoma aerolatum]|uniref:alpha/beta fold hydrolase n=1 Tax=Spirosoma aerolatum TaxID=1211326 RepID=UPI0009AD79ED|nr:alpha/beta hydrolase [Spirosoma aerolatum]